MNGDPASPGRAYGAWPRWDIHVQRLSDGNAIVQIHIDGDLEYHKEFDRVDDAFAYVRLKSLALLHDWLTHTQTQPGEST